MIIRPDTTFEREILFQFMAASSDIELKQLAATFPESVFFNKDALCVRKAMARLIARGEGVDNFTLYREIPVGPDGLKLVDKDWLFSIQDDGYFKRINMMPLDNLIRREKAKRLCSRIVQIVGNGFNANGDAVDEPDLLIAEVIGEIERMRPTEGTSAKTLKKLVVDYLDGLDHRRGDRVIRTTGLPGLGKLVRYELGTVWGVAGRPGGGKSAYLLDKIFRMPGRNGYMFSIEMGYDEIAARALARTKIIAKPLIKEGNLSLTDYALLKEQADKMTENVHIDVSDTLDISAIEQRIYNHYITLASQGKKLDYFVVDYLQIIPESNVRGGAEKKRYQVVGDQVKRLRSVAKRLDVIGFLGVQCGRDVDKRSGKITMSDLRESGDIEAHIDAIEALQRNIKESSTNIDVLEIDILKQRGGRTGKVNFLHHKEYNLFEEEPEHE